MDEEERPLFILAGNGPYANRGCEAIVRGTTKILREHFKDPRFLSLSLIQSEEQFRKQCLEEIDPAITHLRGRLINKDYIIHNFWRRGTVKALYHLYFNRDAYYTGIYANIQPHLNSASAVLSVGGDNYHIDGRLPIPFTSLDDLVTAQRRPLIIWGASVGPFSAMPDYERYMSHHLQKATGIFARESATIDYLKSIGVTENVYSVADPAFLMDPVKPEGIEDILSPDEEVVGLNLSPLMAKYVTDGDLEAWVTVAASIIKSIAQKLEMPVYLIPHVTEPGTNNDHVFMEKALSLISKDYKNITLIPPTYNAAETKWIIRQMTFFAGARTHSTIAALSSGIPTLSFAYSIKARGINHDIFGHADYCLEPIDMKAEVVSSRLSSMLDKNIEIQKHLSTEIPRLKRAALHAGFELKQLIRED
jgi:colanic acid/amylovoran biosynthesis protein